MPLLLGGLGRIGLDHPDGAGPVRQDGDLWRGREGQRSQLGQQHRGGQDVQDLARQRTGDTPAHLPRGMRSIR